MPNVLREWSAPDALIESLAAGRGIEAAVTATKTSFAQFLIEGGIPATHAGEAADALMVRIIAALARGDSPENAVALAQRDVGKLLDQLAAGEHDQPGRGEALAGALAQGGAEAADLIDRFVAGTSGSPEARKAAVDAFQATLAAGGDLAAAEKAASGAAQAVEDREAAAAVTVGTGDALVASLSRGGAEAGSALAAHTAGMTPEQAAAFTKGLLGALAAGLGGDAALQAGLENAAAQAQIAAAQTVPQSAADALMQALASGADVAQALAAAGLGGETAAAALAGALAGGASGADASAAAQAAVQAQAQMEAAAATGGDMAALMAALATGGAAAAGAVAALSGSSSDNAAFVAALSQALASGTSAEAALQSANAAADAAHAQQAAAEVPLSPGAALAAALASGENLEAALQAAGLSGGEPGSPAATFADALMQALAGGSEVASALDAAQAAAAAAEQQIAQTDAQPATDQPAGAEPPAQPAPQVADAGNQPQPPADGATPQDSPPGSQTQPPVTPMDQLLNPLGAFNPNGEPAPQTQTVETPLQPLPVASPATTPPAEAPTAPATPSNPIVIPSTATSDPAVNGRVVDGPVAGATVFVDKNGNHLLDPGEYSTTTDADGNFSIPADRAAQGALVSTGGRNDTGLPFAGTMTAPAGSTVLTPLTTLLDTLMTRNGLSADAAQAVVRTAFGLPSSIDLTQYDPIPGATGKDGSAVATLAAGISVETTISLISAVLQNNGAAGSSSQAGDAAMAALANRLLQTNAPVSLSDAGTVKSIFTAAQTTAATATGTTAAQALLNASSATTDQYANVVARIIADSNALAQGSTVQASSDPVKAMAAVALVADGATTDALKELGQFVAATLDPGLSAAAHTVAAQNLANSISYATGQYTAAGNLNGAVATAQTAVDTNQTSTSRAPPVAIDHSVTTDENTAISIAVLTGDSDPAGGALTLVSLKHLDTNGVIQVTGNQASFDPRQVFDYLAAGATATDTFGYVVANSAGQTATGTVTVTITGVNDAPTGSATAALAAGTEDTAYTVGAATLLQGFSDVDAGDSLSVSGLSTNHGTVTDNGNGTYTVTPTTGYSGAVTLNYSVTDGHGGSTAASESLTLAAIPVSPYTATLIATPHGGTPTSVTGIGVTTDFPVPYKITLSAGHQYTFSLNKSAVNGLNDPAIALGTSFDGTYSRPYMFSHTGLFLAFNDDSNGTLNSQMTYNCTQDGDYYIYVSAYPSENNGNIGNADLTVTTPNTAPVLAQSGSAALTTISEGTVSQMGTTVASLIGTGWISDFDATTAPKAIAVSAADGTNGTWEYSTDSGASWQSLGVDAGHWRLLSATDQLAFVPTGDWTGTTSLSYHAWDLSSGTHGSLINTPATGGATAFSTDTGTMTATVTPTPAGLPTTEVFSSSTPTNWVIRGNSGDTEVVGGVLQLTAAHRGEAGEAFYNTPISLQYGLHVSFDFFSGDGDGADGISFFLFDGSTTAAAFSAGATGAGLGYGKNGSTPGLHSAYLGIGFDTYGGFAGQSDSVAMRSHGEGTTGYNLISDSQGHSSAKSVVGGLDSGWYAVDLILSADHKATLTMSQLDGSFAQTIYNNFDFGFQNDANYTTPTTVKFGFAASTGGSYDQHLIDNVMVNTLSSTTLPVAYDDHALGLNGATSVSVANSAALGPTDAFTLEAWIETTTAGTIISNLSGSTGYQLTVDASGHLQFTAGSGTPVTGSTSLFGSGWHQVAAAYGGSTLQLYVDGSADGDPVTLAAPTPSSSSTLSLGTGLTGAMNEASIWSTVRASSQIASDMTHSLSGSESGLAGYWKFDETTGTSAAGSAPGTPTGNTVGAASHIDLNTDITVPNGAASYKGMILGFDPNDHALSYTATNGSKGSVTLSGADHHGNIFVYTPTSGPTITQDDTFVVTMSDGTHSADHTVTLHVA